MSKFNSCHIGMLLAGIFQSLTFIIQDSGQEHAGETIIFVEPNTP